MRSLHDSCHAGLLSGLDPEKDHVVYIGARADFSDGCQSTGGVWAPVKNETDTPSSMGRRDEDDAPAGYLGPVEASNPAHELGFQMMIK